MDEYKSKINEFAIASLVIGIVSFISLGGLEKAILAIVFGALALKRIEKENQLSSKKLAKAGILLGIFSLILTINLIIKFYPKFQQLIKQIQSEDVLRRDKALQDRQPYDFR